MHDIFDTLNSCGIVPDTIQITDVGAMDAGGPEQWSRLVDQGRANLLGFEPQEEECDRCNAKAGAGRRFLPVALGDGANRLFHQCRYPPTSSFYKPNLDVITRFDGLAAQMEVVDTRPIPTKRLDDIDEARQSDFLKLDVQGTELDILAHGTEVLRHVGMIQIEVCFLPLYEDQPLFADIDTFLRNRGFDLFTLLGIGTRVLRPLLPADISDARQRQALWADAVYLKAQDQPPRGLDPATLLKRAVLLHELYQAYDFVARDLQDYDRITGQRTFEAYASMLRGRQAA